VIPLGAYAGKVVTLRLTTSAPGATRNLWPLFQYPRIDTALDTTRPSTEPVKPAFLPRPTAHDVDLHPARVSLWQTQGMQQVSPRGARPTWTISTGATMQFLAPLNLCLADYTHILVRMAASSAIVPRAMQIYIGLNRPSSFNPDPSGFTPQTYPDPLAIPLLPDSNLHTYSYDLKLLQAPADTRLTSFALSPIQRGVPPRGNWVRIVDIRFLRSNTRGSLCTS
jgi:hypothetical protein